MLFAPLIWRVFSYVVFLILFSYVAILCIPLYSSFTLSEAALALTAVAFMLNEIFELWSHVRHLKAIECANDYTRCYY